LKAIRSNHLLAHRGRIVAVAIACLAMLGYVDWLTGPNVAITCFYLIPVCLLTWFVGRGVGYSASALQALVWLAIDIETIGWHPILPWNAVVRFVTFAAVVWLVYLCKNLMGEVEKLVRDKTEVLQREVESRAASAEAIRRLANELSAAEDVERRRLGQELHDSLGQSLSLLKLRLESLRADLPPENSHRRDLEESLALLTSTIQDSRTLTFELYPSMLDQLGLSETLQHYASELGRKAKATIRVVDFGTAMTLPAPIGSFLFRAVKELITNALKHGPATEVVVQVRRDYENIRIVVSDDGKGFSDATNHKDGLGLAWMRERLRSFGGKLSVESSTGQGARVTIDLPVIPTVPQN